MTLTEALIEQNRQTIVRMLESTGREGVDNVVGYLHSSGFFTVPSSRHRHHNWRGGLAQHCLGVCMNALALGPSLPRDSVILCGLLHDVCKASTHYYDGEGTLHHRNTHIKGHGRRSVKLLQMCGLELKEDERLAIRWHMGGHHAEGSDREDVALARSQELWRVIHAADKMDAAGKTLRGI